MRGARSVGSASGSLAAEAAEATEVAEAADFADAADFAEAADLEDAADAADFAEFRGLGGCGVIARVAYTRCRIAFMSPAAVPAPSPHQSTPRRASEIFRFRQRPDPTAGETRRRRSDSVPGLPLEVDQHDLEEPRREQLLALRDLRRGLERVSPRRRGHGGQQVAVDREALVRELDELIAALDRRVPRVERAGEASIARDAAALREKAIRRLAELSGDA